MPTTYTLSYDFGQLLNTAAPVALSAYVQTNLDQLDGSPLIASGEIRLGGGQLSFVDKTGVGSVSLVGSDSTDLNVPAGSLQYQVVASYVAPGKGGGKRAWLSGWFTLTANSDLSGLATTGTPTAPDPGTPASLVDFTPSGTLTAGDVQAALVELDGDVQAVVVDVADRVEVREAPLSPYRYGFVGDGVADDTAALQATIDAVPAAGGEVFLPHTQNAKLLGKVTINKSVTLRGKGQHQRLLCSANGLEVAAGINDVHLQDFGLLAATRYTTTPNTQAAISTLGTAASRNNRIRVDNVRVDGFERALDLSYVWASDFSRITTAECFRQIDVYGLSVNNTITRCNLSAARIANSTGLRFRGQVSAADTTAETAEGWRIVDNLIFGAKENIDLRGVRYFDILANIIDWSQGVGIWLRDNGTHYSGAHKIIGNYIAVGGSSGQGGIRNDNNIAKLDLDVVQGNLFNAYAATDPVTGLACAATAGVWADDPHSAMIIEGNTSRGFATNDIRLLSSGSIVRGNSCTSAVTNNINPNTGTLNLVEGNIGTVFRAASGDPTAYRVGPMGKREYVWTAPPTGSAREAGERVINAVPTVGQPRAWVCTAAGTPGTWVSEGNL